MVEPYYEDNWVKLHCGDCREVLPDIEVNSVDLTVTDPPYGIGFMGKDWDKFNEVVNPQGAYEYKKGFKKLPRQSSASMLEFFTSIWEECLRILKPGAFAFVMSIPRADCLSRMIISLEDVGFRVDFTPIFWAYASGFPKAQNIGKVVDKRLGLEGEEYMREDFVKRSNKTPQPQTQVISGQKGIYHKLVSPQAKALDGSYSGFQPKPAVEVIIVAMKPLSEKAYVDQALKNRKGITWLDDCRIPYEGGNVKPFGNMPQNKSDCVGFERPWMKDKQEIIKKQQEAIDRLQTMHRKCLI